MDFSSVFVIINLQTWVLLLDYLGIGIPTPPPSRPETPEQEMTQPSQDPGSESITLGGQNVHDTHPSGDRARGESLPSDAKDMLSLGGSLYMSTFQAFPEEGRGHDDTEGTGTETGGVTEEAYSSVSTPILAGRVSRDQGMSVWGMEGKISVWVKLNVNSLTVTFNKPEHPLARGGVSGVTAEVKLRRGNIEISGSLGQGSVMDMTETGAYYRERCENSDRISGVEKLKENLLWTKWLSRLHAEERHNMLTQRAPMQKRAR